MESKLIILVVVAILAAAGITFTDILPDFTVLLDLLTPSEEGK